MTEMATTTLRRLNGRPQACDPCRARKVACDHTHPVCNRCRKRRQATTCTYTIADTSRRVPRTSPSSPLSPAAAGTRGATTTTAKRRSREMSNHNGASSPSTGSSSTVLTPGPSSAAALAGPGYLGFTSFTAVFEEARDSLNLLQGGRRGLLEECDVSTGLPGAAFIGNGITATTLNSGNNRNGGASGGVSPKDDAISLILNGPTREMCLVVLRNIPDLSDKEIFIAMQTSVHAGAVWTSHAARTILHELKDNPLLRDRTEPNLEALAQTLCRNTARPMDDGVEGWEQWSAQFTGANLRWESLGLLFTYKELFTDDEDKKVFWSSGGGRNQRMQKSWRMTALACMRLCLDLAKSFCDGNLLLLHLCFRRSVMESMAVGDASLTCWRSHAEAVSLLSFLGLHAEPDPPNYVPSFSSEMKRRMFAYVFNIDKVSASFQGRPPLLGHRYASTPLPLDITDEVLMRGRDAIIEAASKLDERGWSDDPIMSAAKLIRGRTMLARIKDELLEIALGNSKHVSVDTLLDIKARATDVVAHFPRALIYKPDEDHDDPNLDVTTIYSRMLTRIEYLQNHFFAERLLLRRGHVNDGELLHISFEMVSLTLTFWVHKDRFADVRPDFEWLVMEYAAPGGGILCMELLRPTISHAHPRDPGITRSTIIQRLSLLVGFLDWVSPDAPNADLCMNCKTVIRRVLDHALNGPASSGSSGDGAASSSSPGGGGGGGGGSGNAVMVGAFDIDVMGSYFNFDLLDTFDWLRSDENNQMGEL